MDENGTKSGKARMWRRPMVVAAIGLAAVTILATGLGTSRSVAAGPEAMPLPPTQYLPSISDMMIATIQPRHERLWQAGQDGNWAFAGYELGNLKGAFNRLGHAHPTEHDMSFPEMIASVTDQPSGSSTVRSNPGIGGLRPLSADLTDAAIHAIRR
jgi:hypothetical protein